jgi:hypothetical protein
MPFAKAKDENLLDDLLFKEFDLLDVVMTKFNMEKSQSKA